MAQQKTPRRDFLAVAGISLAGLALPRRTDAQAKELTLYVGTYTSGKSEGIYVYRVNATTGELKHFSTTKGVADPSFLAIDHERRCLYAVNEVEQFGGKASGAISAFAIDQKNGNLSFLNQQPSLGGSPCHLLVDKTNKFVLVANYTGGNVSVLPIKADGSLGVATDMVQHHGSSVNKERQEGPHAHCIELDKANRFAFAVDLGLDKILIYKFDGKGGKLVANDVPFAQLNPGDGPRHLTFHPSGKYAYVINELAGTIAAFSYNPANGSLQQIQTVPTLPQGFAGANTTAEIAVTPSGKFLYGSNRGHDSIVGFAVDPKTGKLTFIEHVSTQGKTPRNFTIDPTGTLLLVANQESNSIVSFRINQGTGQLEPTGKMIEVPTPVCLVLTNLVPGGR
ncbi:MAG TPA: lactonase family protein [Pyrinomonadaceae bacterium]|nr:lactonase family protein [Pyrinomonadaceae bacterium]